MTFNEIKNAYDEGKISIKEYRLNMFEKYEELLQYKKLINNSHVSKITISGEEVIFTITNHNVKNEIYDIDMVVYEDDAVAVPATILSVENGYEAEELEMVNILCDYIRPMGVFLDIGANLGWYTLNVCKQHSNLTSYAFEPIKQIFDKMQRNIELNGIENCKLYNIGLSNKNEEITFFYDLKASGASSMVDLRELGTTVKVNSKVQRLDDFIKTESIEKIDFIKCDVEGAELLVYQGGIKSIKEYKPIIFTEMLRKWSAKFNYHPNDIINLLKELGYQSFVLAGNNKLKCFGYVDDETVETNYFFLHTKKHDKIIQELCQ